MSTPTFEVVTSMSQTYYDRIGHKMLSSFVEKWPNEIKLKIYTEDKLLIPENSQYEIYNILELEPELESFIERHKDRPDQQNPKELHLGAIRFSYKTFSIINACTNSSADYVIWLDADTFTHTDIPIEFLESLTRPNQYLSYLGRENNYSECGFVIYNQKHGFNTYFMSRWRNLYTSDSVFKLPQWHDSYVFDVLRKHYETEGVISNINMTPWGKDYDHVFINSDLGKYMDHMKGNRKYEGKSNKSDLLNNRNEEYWRTL